MSRRIIKKPQLEKDLIQHFAFIARDKLAPAERFLKVAQDSLERLAAEPGLGRLWESPLLHLSGIRVYPMPSGFRRYLIFYRVLQDSIEVLTILHGSRDLRSALDSALR